MDECNPAIYRADLPQPSMELPGAGGCAGYALLGVAEALDQEAKADQNGGTARASHRSADHALRSRRPGVPRRIKRCRCPRTPSVSPAGPAISRSIWLGPRSTRGATYLNAAE